MKSRQSNTQGTKHVRIDSELHHKAKLIAVGEKRSLRSLVEQGIIELLGEDFRLWGKQKGGN